MKDIVGLFNFYRPVRHTILTMLRPAEIATFLVAIGCSLRPIEHELHMNILDDIFEDSSVISTMQRLGMTVRVFGADLQVLEDRLLNPGRHAKLPQRALRVFVLVTEHTLGNASPSNATLVRDYRPKSQQGYVPDDLSIAELQNTFGDATASEISLLSNWILCAPYLAGTMPNLIPGWVPVFNARPFVDVRTYISTYNDSNGRILHLSRPLIRNVFGCTDDRSLFLNLSDLKTTCYKFYGNNRTDQILRGSLTMNMLHNVLAAAQSKRGTEHDKYIIVNSIYPLNSSLTLIMD